MKPLKYLLILSMSFLLLACDKEDEESSSEAGLKGAWEGTFQNLKASEGGTYPVKFLFKDDGRFAIVNLESDSEVAGHYESYLTLKAVTLKVFGEDENELSLHGVKDYSFRLEENELELSAPFSLFRLKRTASEDRETILGLWNCLDQDDGTWVLNLSDKSSFELYYLVNNVNSLSMKGQSIWNKDRSKADLVVALSTPYRNMNTWSLTLNEEEMSIYIEADNDEYQLKCNKQ